MADDFSAMWAQTEGPAFHKIRHHGDVYEQTMELAAEILRCCPSSYPD